MKRSTSSTTTVLMAFYDELVARFGHRNWWPGETPFEVIVGAVLTQNTAWKNATKAIDNLKAASALDPFAIHAMAHEELAQLIRPAGYYNVKARRLQNVVTHFVIHHRGDFDSFFASPVDALRKELLSINGVGRETADSIILYAAGKPIFVVDAYTGRVLSRHGLAAPRADYQEIQDFFHAHLPRDAELYNDFHAQLVAVGHYYCKKKPMCDECPLARFLETRPN